MINQELPEKIWLSKGDAEYLGTLQSHAFIHATAEERQDCPCYIRADLAPTAAEDVEKYDPNAGYSASFLALPIEKQLLHKFYTIVSQHGTSTFLKEQRAQMCLTVAKAALSTQREDVAPSQDLHRKIMDAMREGRGGGRCRDCADEDGRCPSSGELCDPLEGAFETLRNRGEVREEVERLRERLRFLSERVLAFSHMNKSGGYNGEGRKPEKGSIYEIAGENIGHLASLTPKA